MYCPNCGTPNEKDAEKCVNCGKPLPKLSPTGEPIPVEQPAGGGATTPSGEQPNNWPGTGPLPGQPGSQYSYGPPAAGAFGSYNQPGYAPYHDYSVPADRIGVARTEAGPGARLGAYIIDAIITGIITGIVFVVPFVFWAIGFYTRYRSELIGVCESTSTRYNSRACGDTITDILINRNELGTFLALFFGLILAAVVLTTLYYTVLSMRGGTIGKRVFGLRVVREDGSPLSFGRSLLRHTIGYWLSGAFFGLGFIWIIFDPQRQGWHDKIAGTYVVRAE